MNIISLLSILFMTFHLSDDIQGGMAPRGVSNMVGVLILVVWLYGTLVLAERRSGSIIFLVGSLLGFVPVVHMMGAGIAKSTGSLLRLDTHRARRDRDLLCHPLGARTTELATGPASWTRGRQSTPDSSHSIHPDR
jgi:hypothetical protein